ncbi:N-formylglutamate amidohydrolase [Bradyrhizobium canariense]|uniref:N-formylglutamate amidohydrolase n=1 Tax=Bradyrhizobium canariense TaxID=255045 RepID=UPI001CA4B40E|nr:N-formylglutamate amidohydrolase [Bradyrhizobium canariense]MBW5437975.1 N-formylglutamate amidohydrolase [Bradyrhizobium canariense]
MMRSIVDTEKLLQFEDPEPVGVLNGNSASDFLLSCEHAGNAVPAVLNGLGLGAGALNQHIAIDIGILGVSEVISGLIGAPLVFQRYSRLVAECNRRVESDQVIPCISDGTVIPGNQALSKVARMRRIEEIVLPYHQEIAGRLNRSRDDGAETIFVSMHSFTPSLNSAPASRPWHVGLCTGPDERFSRHVETALRAEVGVIVGFNEPYNVDMTEEYAIPIHAEARQLPYCQLEIRQDLIKSDAGQIEWGRRVACALEKARNTFFAELRES